MKYQGGNSNDLAEMIIDYKKKTTLLLNPDDKKQLKGFELNFNGTPWFIILFITLTLLGYILAGKKLAIALNSFSLFLFLISIIVQPLKSKYHEFGQFLFNDYFQVKYYAIIKDINKKTWTLPYKFRNRKFDVKMYGDYKKMIEKIHIKPKDYYIKRWNKKELQDEEWDAVFSFSDIPRKGKMEVTWI